MSGKTVPISIAKPRAVAPVDDWVKNRLGTDEEAPEVAAPALVAPAPKEGTVRLTIDIPKSMHKRLKRGALDRDVNIADVIRGLIDREFPAP